jgi:hypothetical protein
MRSGSNDALEHSAEAFRKALSVLSEEKTPRQWKESKDSLDKVAAELKRRGLPTG